MLYVNQEPEFPDTAEALRHSSCLEVKGSAPRRALVAYSLGNFTSCMVTDACKLGVVLSMQLERQGDEVQWRAPGAEWFYNVCGFFKKGPGSRSFRPANTLPEALLTAGLGTTLAEAKRHMGL